MWIKSLKVIENSTILKAWVRFPIYIP